MMNKLYKFWAASLTRQLMIGIALVHAVLMSVFVLDLVDRQRDFMLQSSREGAVGLATTLAANGSSWILADDIIGIEEVIASQVAFPDLLYAMFLDMNGKVLGFSDRTKVGQYIEDTVSLQLLRAPQKVQILIDSPQLVDIAVPVNMNSRQIGWARVGLSRSEISNNLHLVTVNGIIYTVMAILAGLFFGWFMAKKMTLDIRNLEENANLVWDGNTEVDFILNRSDELGRLSVHFDRMVKKREDILSLTHQKLARSEERFQLALAGANDGLWDRDLKTNEIYYSPRWKSMLGYEDHELANLWDEWKKRVHPDDLDRILTEIQATVDGEKNALKITYRLRHKDGRYRWILARGKVVFDTDGLASRLVGTHVDITDRIEAEIALKRGKEEWERTFDAISDIITIQDREKRVVRVNKAAARFLHKDPDDMIGKLCYQVLHGNIKPCQNCPMTGRGYGGNNCTEMRFPIAPEKTFQVSSAPIFDENGEFQYLVHTARDITEQKKQDQLELRINLQQEQLKRFESLKRMAGAIAHRFNNSMMAVQGNLDLMIFSLPDGSEQKKNALQAQKAARGASSVGSMLLSYVGERPLLFMVSNFSNLVRDCVEELSDQFSSSISINFTPPSEPLFASLDQRQMKEVVINIITNGVEALDGETGEIEISFGSEFFRMNSFPLSFQKAGTESGVYTFCQIRDTGHGISRENLQRVFEPFFTTRFVGRGLGLALTLGIMRSHHGAVLIESNPGSGTTVRILLPVIETLQKATQRLNKDTDQEVVLAGNILLADDEEIVRDVGKRMLGALGFTVHTAVNGLEAVEMFQRGDIDYRAVVLDISMPDMDGFEAMREIRENNVNIPVLLSSGYPEKDIKFEEEYGNRPDGFLQKPFELSDLQKSLEKLLIQC